MLGGLSGLSAATFRESSLVQPDIYGDYDAAGLQFGRIVGAPQVNAGQDQANPLPSQVVRVLHITDIHDNTVD